jgi:hypothetical protein
MDSGCYTEISLEGVRLSFYSRARGEEYEISASEIRGIGILDCMQALKKFSPDQPGDQFGIVHLVVTVDDERFPWERGASWVFFDLHVDGSFSGEFSFNVAMGTHEDELINIIGPLLMSTCYELKGICHGDDMPAFREDGWHSFTVILACFSEDETFADFLGIRKALGQGAFLPRELIATPFLALRAVQLGQLSTLIGQRESEWLEVKSSPYDYKSDKGHAWKLELAKDVAQFANSSTGGLLIIGLHTKRADGFDIIDKVTSFPYSGTRIQSYRDIIRDRVHPVISGLELDAVRDGSLCIVYIFIPPQVEESKPYLVVGALVDDVYEAQGITIVRRHGDASIPVTAKEIHATIVAGRALLRGDLKGSGKYP